jgi:hypothetical protein
MKVYQVISEATPPSVKPSARMQARQQAVQANAQAATQAQQQQATTQAKAAATQAKASADSQARRAAYAAKGLTDKPPKIVRDVGRVQRQNNIRYQKNIARAAVIEKGFLGQIGKFGGWLFTFLSLMEPTRQLWATVSGLEDDYKNNIPVYDGKPMTKEEFEAEREFAYGVYQTQILLPTIARLLKNTGTAVKIAQYIKNTAATISAPASAGLSIGAALATDAALFGFAKWLGSDTAQNYMADKLMPYIKGFGWAGTSLVDLIWNGFTGSSYATNLEKDKVDTQNKKKLDTATTPQQRQAAQQEIDKTNIARDKEAAMATGMKDLK